MEAPWNQEGSPFILSLLPTELNSGQEQRRNAHWPSSITAELAVGTGAGLQRQSTHSWHRNHLAILIMLLFSAF